MKEINEREIWDKIQKSLPELPYLIELPLSFLEAILWPQSSENELKYKGKLLAYILRKHGCIVTKRNGKRYVIFPKHVLAKQKKEKGKSMKTSEPEHVLVSEAWKW
jgi:hypothetical protein